MSAITIRLAWPPDALKPNARPNRWEKAAAVRTYRMASKSWARDARDCRTEYPLKGPIDGLAVFSVPKGNMPDSDNALSSIKAAIDGIADAGVIVNDRDIQWQVSVERGVKREVVVILKEREG
jgi:Holliday junction resolvase RusA-like endonuclease